MHPSHPSHPSNNRRVDRRSYADLANPSGPPFHPDRRPSGRGPGATNVKHHVPPMMNHRPPVNLNTRGPAEGRMRGGDDFRAMGGAPGLEQQRPSPASMHWESSNSGPRGGERSLVPPMMMMRNLPPPSNVRRSRDTGSVSSEGEILSDSELTPPPPVRYSDSRGGADVMYASTHLGGTYASLSQEEYPPRRLPPPVIHPEARWHARDAPPPVRGTEPHRPPDSHYNNRNSMEVSHRPLDVTSHCNINNMEVPQRPPEVSSHFNLRNMEVPPPRPPDVASHYNSRNMEVPPPRPPDVASHYNNRNMEVPPPRPPDVASHYNNRSMEVPPLRPPDVTPHLNNRNMEVPPLRPPDVASHYNSRNMEVPPPRNHASHRPPDVRALMDFPPPDSSFHTRGDTEFSLPREPERRWLDRPPEVHCMPPLERDRMPLPEHNRVPLPERDRMPLPERDRMLSLERDRMLLPERDRMLSLERDRMPLPERDRMLSLERDRMPPLERDRMPPQLERDRMPPERPERDRLPFRAARGSRRGKGGRRWRNAEHRASGPRNEMERRNVREESHYAPPPMVTEATPPLPTPQLEEEKEQVQEADPSRMEEEPPVVIEELLPPPPAEPSALVAATIRAVDLEAQMEYEYAKFMRLTSLQQCLRAEYHVLERLAVGIPAFQADYDAYLTSNPLVEVPLDPTSGPG